MNDTHHTMEHNHSMEGMCEMNHASVQMGGMDHHAMMVQDFKRRFVLGVPDCDDSHHGSFTHDTDVFRR